MPSLEFSERAARDLKTLHDFIAPEDPNGANDAIALILDALDVLERHPLIGRAAVDPLRELIISHGHSGYVALYQYDSQRDRIIVKAIRHQHEVGFDET